MIGDNLEELISKQIALFSSHYGFKLDGLRISVGDIYESKEILSGEMDIRNVDNFAKILLF